MVELNPELLMAYIDGELDAEQKASVEAWIARDPEARAMAESFRESGEMLRENFDEILNLPLPRHLIDTVRKNKADPDILPLRPWKPKAHISRWPGLALAASIALFVGVLAGATLFRDSAVEKPSTAANLLQKTCESQPMGAMLVSDDKFESVTPVLTFLAADGRVCREFERQTRSRKKVGIACRNSDGQWVAFIEIDRILLAEATGGESDYKTASGPPDLLDTALSALGAGRGLTPAEEQRLRSQGWQ